jgi:hypothetical protein
VPKPIYAKIGLGFDISRNIVLAFCQNPKSQIQIIAEIPNCCQNPKPLPKSQTVAKVQIAAKILLNLGFWQQFRILATVWIFAIIWDLEFWQLTYTERSFSI